MTCVRSLPTHQRLSIAEQLPLINKVHQLPEERGARIPAAALTAYAGVEDRMRALSAGYQMHILKQVEPAELTTVVASLAERYAKPAAI